MVGSRLFQDAHYLGLAGINGIIYFGVAGELTPRKKIFPDINGLVVVSGMSHILVTGSHRSGTTWTGNMIALSNQVFYIDEIFNPTRDPGRCRIVFDKWFTHISPGTGEPYSSALRETIVDHRYRLITGLQSSESLKGAAVRIREYCRNFVASFRPDLRSLLKDPIALFSAEWLAESFDMDVVVMIRHPAGFVSSLVKNSYYFPFEDLQSQQMLMREYLSKFDRQIQDAPTRLIEQAILEWRIFYSVVHSYQRRHPSWLFVRYEDLAADPVTGFMNIYQKLNLDWSPALENKIVQFSSPYNPVETNETMAIKRNSQELIQQWKNRLSAEEISLIKEKSVDVWSLFYQDSDW
jgi:hypothetical protein